MWNDFERSGRHVEASWRGLEASWRELERALKSLLKAAGGLLEASWRRLEGSGRRLEAFWRRPGSSERMGIRFPGQGVKETKYSGGLVVESMRFIEFSWISMFFFCFLDF